MKHVIKKAGAQDLECPHLKMWIYNLSKKISFNQNMIGLTKVIQRRHNF